jgi:hypothetical protein
MFVAFGVDLRIDKKKIQENTRRAIAAGRGGVRGGRPAAGDGNEIESTEPREWYYNDSRAQTHGRFSADQVRTCVVDDKAC